MHVVISERVNSHVSKLQYHVNQLSSRGGFSNIVYHRSFVSGCGCICMNLH